MERNSPASGCGFVEAPKASEHSKELFMRHVEDYGTCWLWIGAKSGKTPWFRLSPERGAVTAKRAAHALWKGPVPEGVRVALTCPTLDCVNPEHLELRVVKNPGIRKANRWKREKKIQDGAKMAAEGFKRWLSEKKGVEVLQRQ